MHPVSLSFNTEFIKLLNLFSVKSSKLFAIVNLVNGLYSKAVTSNLWNGKINFSIISSSIFILIILFESWCLEISKPFIEATDVKYIWARSNDNPESVHYFSINIFPSKEKREAWGKIYDHEKFQEEWNRLLKEKIGKTEDELDKPLEELELFGLEVDLTNF